MFDLTNLQAHEVSKDLSSYCSLIYMPPKGGKSTLAYNLFKQKALFLATEKGYKGLSGVMAVDITKWSDFVKVTRELKKPEVQSKFSVLVVDTIDLMHSLAVNQVLSTNGVDDLSGIPFGKGYALVDQLIHTQILEWQRLGYGLFFISHATEKNTLVKLPNGEEREFSKYVPTVNKRTLGIVSKFVDNIFFGYLSMSENGQEKRTIFTRETLNYVAGSRFANLPPQLEMDADVIMKAMADAIDKEDLTTDTKESFVPKFEETNFEDIKAQLIKIVTEKFLPSNQMSIVADITEKQLGQGATIKEATENQADALDIILTILEEKVVELGL